MQAQTRSHKTFLLILIALCVGCAPQKRLAMLLARHPELVHDTSMVVTQQLITPADSAYIDFNIAELSGLDAQRHSPEQSRTRNNDLTVQTASGAIATISATHADNYRLQVRTRSDTIHYRDTITLPAYTTRIEYRDKVINQMNNAQSFFFWIGIIALALATLALIIRIVIRFVKT